MRIVKALTLNAACFFGFSGIDYPIPPVMQAALLLHISILTDAGTRQKMLRRFRVVRAGLGKLYRGERDYENIDRSQSDEGVDDSCQRRHFAEDGRDKIEAIEHSHKAPVNAANNSQDQSYPTNYI